ncbi:MAG: hspA 7 [Gammaproteobacteria bacterium]|jgi:HSP20 family protein|nr:hspA 7 [Gammaproteobacteria bacterium]
MNRFLQYEPYSVLNDINRLFEKKFFPQTAGSTDSSSLETSQWSPAVDVKEAKDKFTIKVDLPGIDKKNVTISMEKGVLSIQGERIEEKKEEDINYYRVERVCGRFHRCFSLPQTANEENISAHMSNGVLEITIPKKEIAKSKAIEIKDSE